MSKVDVNKQANERRLKDDKKIKRPAGSEPEQSKHFI